jgi:cytochrome c-type biogenesis protein CcmH
MRYLILLLALASASALAVDSDPPLPTAALQQRYETLTHELRCLVCQNETIADSAADLAADLRAQVRSQLLAGKTDDEIKQYMVARYGDFVLFKPPWQPDTWLLWAGPFLLLAIGALALVVLIRQKSRIAMNSTGINPDDDLQL